mgnify:CR=1 FL=1
MIIRNFDEIIQMKASKITVDELLRYAKTSFIIRSELDDFTAEISGSQK